MNTNMKRVISGLAALGIALSGMALGTSSAWAGEGGGSGEISNEAQNATGTIKTDKNAEGTITISGGAVEHKFNGYRLGYLTSISYNQIESANFDSASMTGYTLATNPTYKDAIETALDGIKDTKGDATKTLKDRYLADKNYCGSECTDGAAAAGQGDTNDPNPLGWFFANYGGGYEKGAPWGGGAKGDSSDATVLRQFATKVSAELGKTDAPTPTYSGNNALKSSKSGYENLVEQGYYLLRDTTDLKDTVTPSDNKKETQSAPILVSTTYKVTIGENVVTFNKAKNNGLGKVDLKNSTPKVAKQVVTDENGTAQTQPDYAIGDTVTYELKSTLPYYTGYSIDKTYGQNGDANSANARTYNIIDTASAGLTVNLTKTESGPTPAVVSVKVTPANGGASVALTEGSDFDVKDGTAPTADPYNGGSTTIIDLGKYVNMVAGSKSETSGVLENGTVTVIFKATLNKKAKISDLGNLQKNPNKVELQYSNNPENMDSKHTTPGDTVNVYTYQFQLKKTDKGGTALQNAKFTVKVAKGISENDNAHVDQYLATKNDSGEWTYTDSEGTAYKFTSGEDGIVSGLTGLDSGTYEVHETEAPAGYTQAFLPKFSVTITPTAKAGTETAFGGTGTYTIDQVAFSDKTTVNNGYVTDASQVDGSGIFQYTIYNAKNLTELPMTGGAGLVAIIAVGVLLAGAGTAAAVRSRKSTSRAVRV